MREFLKNTFSKDKLASLKNKAVIFMEDEGGWGLPNPFRAAREAAEAIAEAARAAARWAAEQAAAAAEAVAAAAREAARLAAEAVRIAAEAAERVRQAAIAAAAEVERVARAAAERIQAGVTAVRQSVTRALDAAGDFTGITDNEKAARDNRTDVTAALNGGMDTKGQRRDNLLAMATGGESLKPPAQGATPEQVAAYQQFQSRVNAMTPEQQAAERASATDAIRVIAQKQLDQARAYADRTGRANPGVADVQNLLNANPPDVQALARSTVAMANNTSNNITSANVAVSTVVADTTIKVSDKTIAGIDKFNSTMAKIPVVGEVYTTFNEATRLGVAAGGLDTKGGPQVQTHGAFGKAANKLEADQQLTSADYRDMTIEGLSTAANFVPGGGVAVKGATTTTKVVTTTAKVLQHVDVTNLNKGEIGLKAGAARVDFNSKGEASVGLGTANNKVAVTVDTKSGNVEVGGTVGTKYTSAKVAVGEDGKAKVTGTLGKVQTVAKVDINTGATTLTAGSKNIQVGGKVDAKGDMHALTSVKGNELAAKVDVNKGTLDGNLELSTKPGVKVATNVTNGDVKVETKSGTTVVTNVAEVTTKGVNVQVVDKAGQTMNTVVINGQGATVAGKDNNQLAFVKIDGNGVTAGAGGKSVDTTKMGAPAPTEVASTAGSKAPAGNPPATRDVVVNNSGIEVFVDAATGMPTDELTGNGELQRNAQELASRILGGNAVGGGAGGDMMAALAQALSGGNLTKSAVLTESAPEGKLVASLDRAGGAAQTTSGALPVDESKGQTV